MVPVGQFWALTLCSENTRRPCDNGGSDLRSANLDNTLQDLRYNGDDGWFVYFRLYAPLQPFFDKSFSLTDFEMTD